jgi:hypothetical protein
VPRSLTANPKSKSLGLYGAARAVLRWVAALRGRRIRLLRQDFLPNSYATLLVVARPPSLRDALALVAASERKVRILVPQELAERLRGRLVSRSLQMICYERTEATWQSARRAALDALDRRGVVAIFGGVDGAEESQSNTALTRAAGIALEAETEHANVLGLTVLPVHLLPPVSGNRETLVRFGHPLFPQDYLATEKGSAEPVTALRFALGQACQENVFSLRPENLENVLADAEQILKTALEEEWSRRPNWKQQAEGFRLSQPLVQWVERVNSADPERVVALGQALAAHREAQRQWALAELQLSGDRETQPLWRRVAGAVESVLGLPVAAYGAVNHLVLGLVLRIAGLFNIKTGEWIARGLMLVGCYAGQIALVAHFWGRSAAGYYAVTLPLSGAYLWRYRDVFRKRGRLLLLSIRQGSREARLRRLQKRFVEQLDRVEGSTRRGPVAGARGAA